MEMQSDKYCPDFYKLLCPALQTFNSNNITALAAALFTKNTRITPAHKIYNSFFLRYSYF